MLLAILWTATATTVFFWVSGRVSVKCGDDDTEMYIREWVHLLGSWNKETETGSLDWEDDL